MKTPFILIVSALFLFSVNVSAGEKPTPSTNLRVADQAEPVDSVVPELSKIVVLCATEKKKEFEKEWGEYVTHHDLKGAELQKTIREVSDQADAYRAREHKAEYKMAEAVAWKAERRKTMREIAERSIITTR
jgi:hypothetical protein